MKCPQCGELLIWIEDNTYEEHGIEESGIIGVYLCENSSCDVDDVYIFTPTDAEV